MTSRSLFVSAVLAALILVGCGGGGPGIQGTYNPSADAATRTDGMVASMSFEPGEAAPASPTLRMMTWKASMTIEVDDLDKAAQQATELVKEQGGYLQRRDDYQGKSSSLRLRVPANALQASIDSLEKLGKVTERELYGDDVTDEYVDLEARRNNQIALRDRLRALLDRADTVAEVLAVEKDLTRVQGDIDSMDARLKVLRQRVDEATLNLTLERKRVLGPLGHVFNGLFWVVEKAFVIRN